jgi:hypothetical protein
VRRLARHSNDVLLALAALALSVHAAFSVGQLGDYPTDGGPPLDDLLHGRVLPFAHARPAMGDLSLFVRAPFAALAYLGDPTALGVYRWGVLPCVLALALLALWLARLARARGTSLVGQLAIVLLALCNPLVTSAIELGHPEELMTASLCVGALVAALQRRTLLAALLLGLALACKQWSVVIVLPVILSLERARLRALLGALATAALISLPPFVLAPASFVHNQLFLAGTINRSPSVWSWLWPLAPDTTRHVLVEGTQVAVTGHRLPLLVARLVHPLLIGVDLLLAGLVGARRRLPLDRDRALALAGLVLLLRCTLDTETMPYYHCALLLDLLAWDALAGERLPLRALAGAAVAYALFDRLTPAVIGGASSLLYGACTLMLALWLARACFGGRMQPGVANRPHAVLRTRLLSSTLR